jgi:quercetin dioxygenase-like cupin family protein
MALQVRRIVTGHDDRGRAVFVLDDMIEEGALGAQVWSTAQVPVDNADQSDGAQRPIGINAPGGSAIRVMSIAPGHRSPMHRTQTLDYGVVLEGEIDLELDGGAVTTARAGDVIVQRGTIHAWLNTGDKPCRIAFILIAAEPLVAGGTRLEPTHS